MQIRLFVCTPFPALPGCWRKAKLHAMKHQLDFEKPIVELQNKLEELKKHPETHSLDIKENIRRNFGSEHPEGYRKALRLMKLAAKFRLPIITFIDTAGAYPGIGAEERHIAEAIAVNLREMMLFEVPIIAAVIGEGGSGGALGIGVADRVLILENAYYSVISPEGCAAILWKDRSASAKAAEALKITAKDLLQLGLVDEVVPEPLGGAHANAEKIKETLRGCLVRHLEQLLNMSVPDRLKSRYQKFRAYGHFNESP